MPVLWTLLNSDKQDELVKAYNLPVYVIKTEFGPEIRLEGVYYGEDMSLEEIDKIMRQPPRHWKPIK